MKWPWVFLTGVPLEIPGLTLLDLKFCILSVFIQPFPGYMLHGGVQCFNLDEAACAVVILNRPSCPILRPKASHF